MIKISFLFDNNSRHINTTGAPKFRATLFCTVTANTLVAHYGTSLLLMFR